MEERMKRGRSEPNEDEHEEDEEEKEDFRGEEEQQMEGEKNKTGALEEETKEDGGEEEEETKEEGGEEEEEVMEEDRMCRYCFGEESDEDGKLISPCSCIGGQKYVHLSCLRKWQRMVLVSQPTHPFYCNDDDKRHHVCNVCESRFTIRAPTKAELYESFSGPEIAALIAPDRIIASNPKVSENWKKELEGMQRELVRVQGLEHWTDAVYLIFKVEGAPEEVDLNFEVGKQTQYDAFRERLDENAQIKISGQWLAVMPKKSLAHAAATTDSSSSGSDVKAAMEHLKVPVSLVLRFVKAPSFAENIVCAVNLTREVVSYRVSLIDPIIQKLSLKFPKIHRVRLQHFIGGPVEEDEISLCLIPGGKNGWTYDMDLESALTKAYARGVRRPDQGEVAGGQTVEITGLMKRPDLNGKKGMALLFDNDTGRWEVRLQSGEGINVKPANLSGLEGPYGRVLVFWGHAGWSRSQLLGECSRGHWGLCRASVNNIIAPAKERYAALQLENKLAFAPITEMTEEYLKKLHNEMEATRSTAESASRAADQAAALLDA